MARAVERAFTEHLLATARDDRRRPTQVAFLLVPKLHLLDLAGPAQVFSTGVVEGDAVNYLTTSYLYGPGGPAVTCSTAGSRAPRRRIPERRDRA